MRTNAYIDGFNLYYACFRHDPRNQRSKWLDLRTLCAAMLPNDHIHRVHYFTAMVSETPWNPGAPLRQETYTRALRTCANLYVHLGNFQPVFRTGAPTGATEMSVSPVTIRTTEPIRVVKQKFNLPIIVMSPHPMVANKLRRAASSYGVLDKSLLSACQLRSSLKDKKGRSITKPDAW